jgi:hypothetical protein
VKKEESKAVKAESPKDIIVDHARLHQTVEVLGAGQIGPTLNKSTIPTLEMKLLPMGLLIKMQNKAGRQCKPTVIPMPNIAAMQLAE